MRVLVVESEPGSGNDELAPLAAAGHQLCRCQEPGTAGFGCRGLERPNACPIDTGVDIAVAFRTATPVEVGGEERGVTCALRGRVPVVVVSQFGHPYGHAVIDAGDDLLATCVQAVAAPAFGHAHAIVAALRAMPEVRAIDAAEIGVDVVRERDGLRVVVLAPVSIDRSLAAALADRAVGAARQFDPATPRIDVAIRWVDR